VIVRLDLTLTGGEWVFGATAQEARRNLVEKLRQVANRLEQANATHDMVALVDDDSCETIGHVSYRIFEGDQ
jgi:hypothetical protein